MTIHRTRHKRAIAYVTGTRADFGLMTPVLRAVQKSSRMTLQVFATGVHLTRGFGDTFRDVKHTFPRAKKIPAMFSRDDRRGMAAFAGTFLRAIMPILARERPDIMLVLGDRVEILCTAVACLYLGIPVAHVHGGEKTTTVDEEARHAITKLSHIHFAATAVAAERLKKMGEDPWRVHVVGAPALDAILRERLPTHASVCRRLNIAPRSPYLLLTQHPVSQRWEDAGKQMRQTLAAVKTFMLPVVAVYPHPDPGGRLMIAEIEKEKRNPMFRIVPSVPFRDFLALERNAAVWVGNSSAAMIESASFGVPVVNVGDRQKGRERGKNVMDVGYAAREIANAIQTSLSPGYRSSLRRIKNPWGDGMAAPRIARVLEGIDTGDRLLNKQLTY